MSTSSMRRRITGTSPDKELLDKAGIPQPEDSRMTGHRFRDTAAGDLFLNPNIKIEEISEILGHKSIAMTQKHYANFDEERRNMLHEKMSVTWKNISVPDLEEPTAEVAADVRTTT